MKKFIVWEGLCLALLLLLGACSKSNDADKVQPMQIQGVNVELPRLAAELSQAPPELQAKVSESLTKVRYRQYVQAMMALEEVSNSPGLNDKQKKLVADVMGQLKEVMSKDEGHQ